jgi:hypothetical protein
VTLALSNKTLDKQLIKVKSSLILSGVPNPQLCPAGRYFGQKEHGFAKRRDERPRQSARKFKLEIGSR